MEDYNKIYGILNEQAKTLVGILLKRIEVLEKEEVLSPSLYKSLVKEIIYEQFRNIRKLIDVHIKLGKVVFKTRVK